MNTTHELPRVRDLRDASYVCREHPDCPVSWKGKGCSRCAARDRRKQKTTTPDRSESK